MIVKQAYLMDNGHGYRFPTNKIESVFNGFDFIHNTKLIGS